MDKKSSPFFRVSVTALLLGATLAGCASTTSPAVYASSLSSQDPKWSTAECQEIRARASSYEANEKQTLSWGGALLFGPYGLGMAAAGKEHQTKQRKLFRREMHMRCSSQPLPRDLQNVQPAVRASN
ncbi:hypothetical protein QBK99_23265 [Corticibacterium sp. UT-5YL-CI-8]|nr:hypothetical protein [Tianweitania sp. UT-5YL-CI-8]